MPKNRLAAVLFLFAAVTMALYGQVASRIEGVVQDQSGAVVPGATVVALETGTNSRAEVTSNAEGAFNFPSLTPGSYTLTVEAKGFRKAVVNNLELNVAAVANPIIKLEIGQTGDTVVVEANSVSVQTTESQISRAVTMRDIDTLPQLARTPITLAIFQTGVQIDVRAGQDASFSHVNGLRQGSNNSRLDGIDINDSLVPRLGLSLTANNTDSIQEFRIVTEGGKAEFGRSAGGQVELVTRSGDNKWRGSAFDYLRNTKLNANDWFNNQSGGTVPKLIQNVYGGSFGGHVIKDKTFFFGNFQGRRTKQETIRNRTVPTADALKGIFTYRDASGAIQKYNFAAADPRGIGIDPTVAKLFSAYPAPNNTDVGDGFNTAGFRFNNSVPGLEDQFTIRGDHHVTDRHVVFLRWSWQRNSATDNLNNADATFPGQISGTQGGHRWGYAIGSDWNITPTIVNEFRIGHQSATTDFLRPNRPQGLAYQTVLFTDINFTTFTQGRNSPVNDITENFTKVLSKHTLKAGTNIRLTKQYGYNEAGIYPTATTGTGNGNSVPAAVRPAGLTSAQQTTFDNLYNDVLGRVDRVTQTFYSDLQQFQGPGKARIRNYELREGGYFIQDDWRIRRNVTLNLGLRYEVFGAPSERDNLQGTVNKASQIVPGAQISDLAVARSNAPWFQTDRNNFAPRFGFAWDVFGNGTTALRGNYGIFYDRQIGAAINSVDANTPGFSQTVPVYPNQSGGDVRYSQVVAGAALPQQPGAPVLQLPETRSTSLFVFNPNLRTGYVQSFALNVQREIARNTIIEVGYVGNRGVKLFMDVDYNQPRIYGDFLNSFRELQAYNTNNAVLPSAGNTLVRIFGSPAAAVTGLGGATVFRNGSVGSAANTLDVTNYARYAAAGVPSTYLRNFPQYNQVVVGTNDGRSKFDSLQVSFRRSAGALRTNLNYTFGKSIDNYAGEGNGFTSVIDSYNLRLNRARSDWDRPHSFNASTIYTLPFGKGKRFAQDIPRWLDTVVGGWDIGALTILQSGQPFTVSSQRTTTAVPGVGNTWINYAGTDRNIGEVQKTGSGAYFFTPEQIAQFSYPAAGEIGNSGRNAFRNPRFFNVDASLVKKFRITEGQSVTFRTEAYNLFNHPNFGIAAANVNFNNVTGTVSNLSQTTFGKFNQTLGTQLSSSSARTLQLSLRYDF